MSVFDDDINENQTVIPDTTEGNGATVDSDSAPSSSDSSEEDVYTIEKYLKGKVRTAVNEDALMSILADAGIEIGTPYADLDKKQKDLATAYLYAYVASSPSTTSRVKDSDGNWSHEEGSESLDSATRRHFLILANDIFKQYNIPTIGSSAWGVSGRGFGHLRNYGNLH